VYEYFKALGAKCTSCLGKAVGGCAWLTFLGLAMYAWQAGSSQAALTGTSKEREVVPGSRQDSILGESDGRGRSEAAVDAAQDKEQDWRLDDYVLPGVLRCPSFMRCAVWPEKGFVTCGVYLPCLKEEAQFGRKHAAYTSQILFMQTVPSLLTCLELVAEWIFR
jgi:hypothetical protein